ncbi:MAG TPA: alpha-1,4-glucan--maltose-1-phosphate maltosyltransferase [Streptosporangiaceae bacterium]
MIGRVPILNVQPAIDGGKWPAKAVAGETFEVSATVFGEGHDVLGAGVVLHHPDGGRSAPVSMRELAPGSDRLGADVTVTAEGLWQFQVLAWRDPIAQWWHDAEIKVPRGQDVELTLADGAALFARAARAIRAPRRAPGPASQKGKKPRKIKKPATSPADEPPARHRLARSALATLASRLTDRAIPPWDRLAAVVEPEILAILAAYPLRDRLTRSSRHPVVVQRKRALYGSWYEFFPRSEGAQIDPLGNRDPVSGTFRTAAARLDAVAEMGFDVVYLPPVHPIGTSHRKGRNNTLHPEPSDPGVPWAIGSPTGGHDAIHPDLGTLADFDAFVGRAAELGLEVALDFALQASPDHPWVTEHPEWFNTRSDGSIAYAENPPKKYQDIYPINFDRDLDGLVAETLRILRHWMSHGVRIFRVDNPHTKALPFWERVLAEVAKTDPDVLFLAEAFTRPAMMQTLAKIGFHQSYTYFTWRNTVAELTAYLRELSGPAAAFMRPNFFVNTPDILSEYLQYSPPAGFAVRAVLAAMLSPSWGVYAGYELCENVPLRPGSEEYMDSEKYQYRPRDWSAAYHPPGGLAPLLTRLNSIRRAHPATHWLRNLRFHHVDQPELICFSKRSAAVTPAADGDAVAKQAGENRSEPDTVLVVVNLDPHQPREAMVWLDLPALGMAPGSQFTVTDELTGASYRWGTSNYVRLDPAVSPAHIFAVVTDTAQE